MIHHQPGVAAGWFEAVALAVLLVASVGYGAAAWRARHRGRWPAHRSLLWAAGVLCAGGAITLPVVAGDHGSFTTHMLTHLLLGMFAPLLLVLAAPVTLALRALTPGRARVLSAVLRSPVVLVLTHPAVAAVLNVGGLWLLYNTDLFHRMHSSDLMYAVVHVHLLVVGYVFTASVIGPDPDPHRASMRVRSLVLVLFIAAHSVLAKWLYAHPPGGVEAGDARLGAQVMYYGGDAVDVAIIVLLFAGHARATRRRHRPCHAKAVAARPSRETHARVQRPNRSEEQYLRQGTLRLWDEKPSEEGDSSVEIRWPKRVVPARTSVSARLKLGIR